MQEGQKDIGKKQEEKPNNRKEKQKTQDIEKKEVSKPEETKGNQP